MRARVLAKKVRRGSTRTAGATGGTGNRAEDGHAGENLPQTTESATRGRRSMCYSLVVVIGDRWYVRIVLEYLVHSLLYFQQQNFRLHVAFTIAATSVIFVDANKIQMKHSASSIWPLGTWLHTCVQMYSRWIPDPALLVLLTGPFVPSRQTGLGALFYVFPL